MIYDAFQQTVVRESIIPLITYFLKRFVVSALLFDQVLLCRYIPGRLLNGELSFSRKVTFSEKL